jgi:hypothetical protein
MVDTGVMWRKIGYDAGFQEGAKAEREKILKLLNKIYKDVAKHFILETHGMWLYANLKKELQAETKENKEEYNRTFCGDGEELRSEKT